jgi:polysaccharide deacetylase 2 family uncharacterized protein YibQ
MRKSDGYKYATGILLAVVVLQLLLLAQLLQKKAPHVAVMPKKPVAAAGAKIAIVLDDWGYHSTNFPILKTITVPLTLSILPNLPFTRQAAQEAHALGMETILHLPMEPHEKIKLERETILTSMDTQAIRAIVARDIDALPDAMGVSNHMGSKATEDKRVMGALFAELNKRHMYFLDSFVSSRTVCAEVARSMSTPMVKRDVFLDNKEDAAYIKGQILKLARKARMYSWAIGIGHDRAQTLAALAQMIPALEKEGFVFVNLSELAR